MSIATLTTVAAVRQERAPGKQDTGNKVRDDKDQPAGLTDLLVPQIPVELVAPYTAVTTPIVGAVTQFSAANPHPDQLLVWRWIAFGLLLVGTVGLVWAGAWRKTRAHQEEKRQDQGYDAWEIETKPRFPALELTGAAVAAAGWALAIPGSPLSPYLDGTGTQVAVPLLIAFAAIVATGIIATLLQKPIPEPQTTGATRDPLTSLPAPEAPAGEGLSPNPEPSSDGEKNTDDPPGPEAT